MTASERLETVRPVIGLRERKKARTRQAIRSQAIRMFAEQGYAATTVEQIAEAVEISPSTFFRYFASKEMVIITDEYDQVMMDSFRNQPAGLSPIRAFRNAVKESAVQIQQSEEEKELELIRRRLLQTEPELRSAMLDQYAASMDLMAAVIGERAGRPPTVRSG